MSVNTQEATGGEPSYPSENLARHHPVYLLRLDPTCLEREPCCGVSMNLFGCLINLFGCSFIDCGVLSQNNNNVSFIVL